MAATAPANIWTRALMWPVVTWVVVNVIFFAALLAVPDMGKSVSPAGLTPLLLAIGGWAGYKIVELGGGYGYAFIAGVVVGAVCAVLDVIGSAIIGQTMAAAFPGAVYFFGLNLFGALIGGGFKLTK